LSYCIGEVGLMPWEFWSMTFTEVNMACRGYETREARRKEVERITAGILANVYRGKGSPAIEMEKLYPLITDKGRKRDAMSKEKYEETLRIFGRKMPTKEDKEKLLNRNKWQNRNSKRNLD
jgi:hypothetical protein